MKKIYYSALLCATLFVGQKAGAQVFSVADTVTTTTTGTASIAGEDSTSYDYLIVNDTVTNNSSVPLTFEWNYIPSLSHIPTGWYLYGICDNITCRNHGVIINGQVQESDVVNAGGSFLLQLNLSAPVDAVDSVAIVRVQLSVTGQTDTATFIVYKNGTTGVAQIPVGDKRVLLYPNPVTANQLNLFTDKSVAAKNVVVYDIAGREVVNYPVNTGTELQSFNVAAFGAGSYVANVMDDNGKVLAVRRFVKQ